MMASLSPCPFCRGNADIAEDSDRAEHECRWTIFCVVCDASTARHMDATQAAAAWNQRTATPPAPAAPRVSSIPIEADIAWQAGAFDPLHPKNEVMVEGRSWYRDDHPRLSQPAQEARGATLTDAQLIDAAQQSLSFYAAMQPILRNWPCEIREFVKELAASSAQAGAGEPLTDEQIIAARNATWDGPVEPWGSAIRFARAIEAAHGISPTAPLERMQRIDDQLGDVP